MLRRLLRTSRLARPELSWQRPLASAGTAPVPHPSLFSLHRLSSANLQSEPSPEFKSRFSPSIFFPAAVLVSAVSFGSTQVAYADTNEEEKETKSELEKETKSELGPVNSSEEIEDLGGHERKRIEDLLKSKGMQHGTYPPYIVSVKGQKVTVKFNIPPACELSRIIVDLVTRLGLKSEQHSGGSEMSIRAWDNAAARQITLNPIEKGDEEFCVLIFESLIGDEFSEIEFIKRGSFTSGELEAVASALKLASKKETKRKGYNEQKRQLTSNSDKSISALESMGVRVYGFDETTGTPMDGTITWENIAGYDEQKREIEDTVLLALQSPEVYDDIARGTRRVFETNRPRAVLFEGPPGTGKTSSARVIAKQAGVPLLYVPLEVIMSKYYGESERLLGNVFSLANDLPNGAIIFLDEVDSFAVARDSEMHEATRRILSVILRQIDGFEQEKRVVVIAATNRKEDLDPALISRFDSMITFDLPDLETRVEIAAQYAKHLNKNEFFQFASVTEGMSGRDIRDVCQQAERHWASKLIRGKVPKDEKGQPTLPSIEEYVKCAEQRRKALPAWIAKNRSNSRPLALA
ncbi:hypothetical protein LUZ60_000283 [Juncus effusus]|nr:hypothetical protein LUZ60_000283 [Juncus effusus]